MTDIRLGVFGARADRRGLASQTTEVCRHLAPERIFGVDMRDLSPYYPVWDDYESDRLTVRTHDSLDRAEVAEWLRGLDVVWGAETFYVPWFTTLAQEAGVRTVLAVNPEFIGHVLAPDWAPLPDRLAPPTDWRLDLLPPGTEPLVHGVCRHRLPYRQRTQVATFLHIAGHPAIYDRAGTSVVIDALGYVRRPCTVIIRSQAPLRRYDQSYAPPRPNHVKLLVQVANADSYWHLYDQGDVLLSPRRYGGQHLPMMEALSCGLPVLATDCLPQNALLPGEMLVPATDGRSFHSKAGPDARIQLIDMHPPALAARMDQMVEEPALVERLSKAADQLAAEASWPAVLPKWRATFEALCG